MLYPIAPQKQVVENHSITAEKTTTLVYVHHNTHPDVGSQLVISRPNIACRLGP